MQFSDMEIRLHASIHQKGKEAMKEELYYEKRIVR